MQKEDLDAFTLDVRLLGDIMHMTPKQTLDKFKDSFDSEILAHLLEANDIEAAKAKAQQLIYLIEISICLLQLRLYCYMSMLNPGQF